MRFWARKLYKGQTISEGWETAAQFQSLTARPTDGLAIGWPIPQDELMPKPLWIGEVVMRHREPNGNILKLPIPQHALPEEMNDPDWWWLIGLWWADGTVSRGGGNMYGISFAIADLQPEILSRVKSILERWNYGWSETQRQGCKSLTFSCRWLHRWLLEEWRLLNEEGDYRPGQKAPPLWVEHLLKPFQVQLMRGYVDGDGWVNEAQPAVVITSVSLQGLLSARRILARLGIAASVRRGIGPGIRMMKIEGKEYVIRNQQRYDIRFRDGAAVLGIDVPKITRNSRPTRTWIANGYLWSLVRSTARVHEAKFVPIHTASQVYETAFGLSHNCFDDVDDHHDTPDIVAGKIESLTRRILPATTNDAVIMGIQNLIHIDSIFAQIADNRVDFLTDRILSGPIPAIRDLTYETRRDESGIPHTVITGGAPTWSGLTLEACQNEINKEGITVFLSELQHLVMEATGGMFDHVAFRHCTPAQVPQLDKVVCWVDPAVTDRKESDAMGIQIDGLARDGTMYRLWSWEERGSPLEAIRLAIRMAHHYGSAYVGIETDQGGDTWRSVYREARESLGPEFAHLTMRQRKAGQGFGSKVHRASQMLADYERGFMVHVEGTHHVLERALIRFPRTPPLDLVDAAFWSHDDLRRLSRPATASSAAHARIGATTSRSPSVAVPSSANPRRGIYLVPMHKS